MLDASSEAFYILAIDQGTTSSRAVVYDRDFQALGVSQHEFPQHFPAADRVEHDLTEIWDSVERSVRGAVAAVRTPDFSVDKIAAIGITNQRETFALWERSSGTPLGKAIVWQCRRSADICKKLAKGAAGRKMAQQAGLVLDPYFSGTKLKWWLDQDKNLRTRAKRGALAFGTIDTFLLWKLTGGQVHATDVSNASRTLMMDLSKQKWNPLALRTLGVPAELLPEIRDSNARFGQTKGLSFLPDGIPICGILGDQQAALFGQACFREGEAKLTYGTGAFFLINTGSRPRRSRLGLSTMAWRLDGKSTYALESAVFIAGAAVQWLRDGLQILQNSSEIETLAEKVPDSDGVFFIPALSGLGSPYWAPEAKGLLGGLTRRSTRAHVARACLEGIAASVADLFEGLSKDAGRRLQTLRVDGGASRNALLLQAQANYNRCSVERPRDIESTARGAAYVAALGAGLVKLSELRGKNPVVFNVGARVSAKQSAEAMKLWRRRVKALLAGAY